MKIKRDCIDICTIKLQRNEKTRERFEKVKTIKLNRDAKSNYNFAKF